MTSVPHEPTLASQDYVQARVAETEGKLERAAREIAAEIRSDGRQARAELRADYQRLEDKIDTKFDALRRELGQQTRWMVGTLMGLGVVLFLAVVLRPNL